MNITYVDLKTRELMFGDKSYNDYKIIIPKEEPEEDSVASFIEENDAPLGNFIKKESKSLNETLGCAKCKAETMFSNEEVLKLLLNCPGPYLSDEEIKEWFEQFKK